MGEESKKIFAKRLREHMEEYGLTQMELAKRIGVTNSAIYLYYNGKNTPRMDVIERMCEVFHCRPSDLLEEKKESGYYDSKTAEIAQALYDNKDLRLLFDAAQDADPESLQFVREMLEKIKKMKSQ